MTIMQVDHVASVHSVWFAAHMDVDTIAGLCGALVLGYGQC